ncbi:MAG: tetratricopeptide repeat protein [Caldilinea sp. CFX5]|nr:tetratricopeptide repeat protein [Caldilinea sp. CFX5]
MAIATPDQQAKFQSYLERNLRYLLDLVATATPLPDAEARSQAMHTLSFALRVPALWDLTRQLLLTLAPKMEQAGHRDDWLVYLEEAATLSEQRADWATAAECYLQRGLLHRLLSDFPLAIDRLQRSVALWQQIDAGRDQARALNELAWVAYLQNQTAPATTYVEGALALLPAADPERAMCYRVQGMIAIAHERWGEAEAYHRQALTLFATHGDDRKAAWSLQNLAYALRGQARYEEAIEYYEQAAALLQEEGDLYHWSTVQMNLGLAYSSSGRPEIAVTCYTAARSIPQSLLDAFHLARLHVNTAIALMKLSEFPQAEKAFLEAIQLHRDVGAVAWRLNAMDGLAMTYIGWKRFDQAIVALQQALIELPTVVDAPNYDYLYHSLHQHVEEAHLGLRDNR